MVTSNNDVRIDFIAGTDLLEDAELVGKLLDIMASVNEMYTPSLYIRYKADTIEVLKEKLYQDFMHRVANGYNFYVLYLDGEPIAFNNHRANEQFIQGYYYDTLEIGTTVVQAEHQNRGYGKYIYSFLEMDSRVRYSVEAIIRGTWSTNLRQIHLYTAYGYEEYIQYRDYYGIRGLHTLKFFKILPETSVINNTQFM